VVSIFPASSFVPVVLGFFGLGAGYLIYGPQELLGYPRRDPKVDRANGVWGLWMAGFCQFLVGVFLFVGLTWFPVFTDNKALYMAALAFSAYGIHWFAMGWNRLQGADARPNGFMSIAFFIISVLGLTVFFDAGAWRAYDRAHASDAHSEANEHRATARVHLRRVHLRGGLSPRAGLSHQRFSLEEVIARIQAVLRRTSSGGYFIGTGGGIRSDSTASQEIAAVVADNFTATTVGGSPSTTSPPWQPPEGRILACTASGWPVSQDDRPQEAPTGAGRADTRPPGRDPRR
jgi:hypothetical protein